MLGLKLNSKSFFENTSREALLLLVFFLALIWAVLINHLRVAWTLLPQYGYGWAVPVLCLYLIWKKIGSDSQVPQPESNTCQPPSSSFYLLLALPALLYAPTRLIEKASPEWSLVSWALALEVVGITLLLIFSVLGRAWLKQLAFPIAFFLVAVPWPSVIESPVIQGLTRADAGVTVELLGWLGIPAAQHGNVIEVATGDVGIDEACSGIRSFQATLMIALFLGQLYRLNLFRRIFLVFGGFAMAFVFNLARMSLLVWIAAHQGITAIAQWHDPTGVTILLICFFALWVLGMVLARKHVSIPATEIRTMLADPPHTKQRLVPLLLSLLVWLAVVEISTEAWYRWHERRLPPTVAWTVLWPTNSPMFKERPLEKAALGMLRCDQSRRASWQENGLQWQTIFIKWDPGTRAQLGHTPDKCMTAAGHTLTPISDCVWFEADGLRLPFSIYRMTDLPQPCYVIYCMWNDRFSASRSGAAYLSLWDTRTTPLLIGLRSVGQRSLEIAVTGKLDAAQAEAAFQTQLEKIIQSESNSVPTGGLK